MKDATERVKKMAEGITRGCAIRTALIAAVWALAVTGIHAQSSTGSIVGIVTDSRHAVIVDAQITVKNSDTNQSSVVRSDQSGFYTVSALQPGKYTVEVSKSGFSDVTVNNVQVNIAANSTVNIEMKVGAASSTVIVTAEAQLIDQSAPTITTAVPEVVSANLPLPERSAMEAVMLSPGVQGDPQYNQGIQSENTGIYQSPVIPGGSLAIGGGRPASAMQLVDGVDLTMVSYPRTAITFSSDDLQQISVQSGGISAKFGRSGGGLVNQASKGGTAEFHGKVAFRHEDPYFEATTYGQGTLNFSTASGTVVRPITQDVHQNLFTGLVGGPVPIPWRHINKNTFFFVSFEPLRAGQKVWNRQRVPTPAELSGDFSNSYTLLNTTILTQQGYAAAIAAPRVGGLDYQFPLNSNGFPAGAHYNSSSLYQPIANYNLSAQLAQNPFAKFVLSQIPNLGSNGTGTSYLNYLNPGATYANDGNNAMGARGVVNTDNRYNIRVDQNLGTADHAFLRFTDVPVTGTRFSYMGPDSLLDNQPATNVNSLNVDLDYSHIIHGNAVNDAHVSYTRMEYNVPPAPATTTKDWAATYGLTPAVLGKGFPSLSLDSGSFGSSTTTNDGGLSINEVFQYSDDYSMVIGRHSLGFGAEWRQMQLDRLTDPGIYGGTYSFSAGNTNNGSSGGNATASFILGSINSLSLSTAQEFYYRFKYFAAYAMDDWKVLPRLTINLGVRYNLEFPRTEKFGEQGSFLPGVTGTLNNVAATGAFAFSGNNGLPTTLYPVSYLGFEPRIGMAFVVTPKMTVRGSYNLMHQPMSYVSNTPIPALTPYALSIGGATGGANSAWWVNYMTNPVQLPSTGVPAALKPSAPVFSYGTGYLPWVSQSNVVPYVENWSASVQYQVSNSAMIQAAYAGSAGHHNFISPLATNLMPLSTLQTEIQSGFNFSSNATSSVYGLGTGNANINILPYPQFYNNPILTAYLREGSNSYNALYVNGMGKLAGGFTVIGAFTWSKSLDDSSQGTQDGLGVAIYETIYQASPYTRAGERSYSSYDTPAHATMGYNWDVPIGKGRALNIQNGLLNALVGGLHASGLFSFQTGYPAAIQLGSVGYFCSNSATKYCGNGNAVSTGLGAFNIRPNIVPGVPLIQPNWRKDPFNLTGSGGYLNPAAFATPGLPGNLSNNTPPTPAFGNAPRTLGFARSPHTIYFDMNGSKDFPIKGDRIKLNLRADAINIFNHTNFFLNPNSAHTLNGSLNSTTGVYALASGFGILSSANNNPGRTFALGASVTF